jgi:hypothetical protein
MLSTVLEALGLAVVTVGVTAGVWLVSGLGFACLAAGLVGGGSLLFVGVALSAPDPTTQGREGV